MFCLFNTFVYRGSGSQPFYIHVPPTQLENFHVPLDQTINNFFTYLKFICYFICIWNRILSGATKVMII